MPPSPLPCLGAGMEVVLNQYNRAYLAIKFVILNNLTVKFVIPEELRAGKSGEPAASHNLSANNKATRMGWLLVFGCLCIQCSETRVGIRQVYAEISARSASC